MNPAPARTQFFKQSHFATHLPVDYFYTRSHFWAEERGGGRLRLGYTKFATRMLGEMVDHQFDASLGDRVRQGDVLGWIEGFKAMSDIICVAEGAFAGGNPLLKDEIALLTNSPYGEGWLYELDGELDEDRLDVNGYAEYLKTTIDRLLEKQNMNPESE